MEKLGLNLGYLLVQIASFVIIFIVLRAWVYRPLLNFIEKRKKTIEAGIENSKQAAASRENADNEAEKILTDARQKAETLQREAREKAAEFEKKQRALIEEEFVKARTEARSEVSAEVDQETHAIRQEVTSLALAAANQLIKKNLDEKANIKIINSFFGAISEDQKTKLKSMEANGSSIMVISALPLRENEKLQIASQIEKITKKGNQLIYSNDPSLLGGLIIRVNDQVLDGSIAAQSRRLKEDLEA